jgi:hypothetical protein
VTENIGAYTLLPFISAGVVHVDPLVLVAYKGYPVLLNPTATNNPDELTVTEHIRAYTLLPFIRAGVVHVDPLELVAYTG